MIYYIDKKHYEENFIPMEALNTMDWLMPAIRDAMRKGKAFVFSPSGKTMLGFQEMQKIEESGDYVALMFDTECSVSDTMRKLCSLSAPAFSMRAVSEAESSAPAIFDSLLKETRESDRRSLRKSNTDSLRKFLEKKK